MKEVSVGWSFYSGLLAALAVARVVLKGGVEQSTMIPKTSHFGYVYVGILRYAPTLWAALFTLDISGPPDGPEVED